MVVSSHEATKLTRTLGKKVQEVRDVWSRHSARRLAAASFWSLSGAVVARIVIAGTWVLLARILGKASLGQLGMVQSTVNMFATAAALGLGMTATKHVAEYRGRYPGRAGRVIGLCQGLSISSGLITGIAAFLGSGWLASEVLNAPALKTPLQIGAVILAFASVEGVQKAILAGFEAFKPMAALNVITALIGLPVVVYGAAHYGLEGALVGMAVAACVGRAWGYLLVKRQAAGSNVAIQYQDCLSEKTILWQFSLPSLISSLIVPPTMWYASALFARQPGGFEQLGIFTAVIVVKNLIVFAGANASAPLLPMIANRAAGSTEELESINVIVSWALGTLMAVPVLCFPEIIVAAFGHDFASKEFVTVQSFTVVSACIIMYKHGLSRILIVRSMVWFGVASNALWGIIVIVACHSLLDYGAVGLATAFLVAYAANSVLAIPFYLVMRVVPPRTIVSFHAAAIWLTLGVLVGMTRFELGLGYRFFIFVTSFAAVLWAFWRMTVTALRSN